MNNYFSYIKYIESIQNQLAGVIQPLKENYNLNFGLTRIYYNGNYFDLRPEISFLTFHYENDLMSQGQFFLTELNKSTEKKNYISFWPSEPIDPYLKWLYDSDIWQGFEIYFKNTEYLEIWTFATSRESPDIKNFYLNNIALLKEFIFYFKEKTFPLIKYLQKKDMPFSESYADFFKQKDTSFFQNLQENQIFKDSIKVKKYYLFNDKPESYLSNREVQCLHYLAQGKTSKEIGAILSLSSRTVESYLEHLKNKLNCAHKSQLISTFLQSSIKFIDE